MGSVAGLDLGSRVGGSVRFFVYDSAKIAVLLAGIVFAVGVLRSFMSIERTRALLGGRREGVGNAMAAGLGVATPVLLVLRGPGVPSASSRPACRSA